MKNTSLYTHTTFLLMSFCSAVQAVPNQTPDFELFNKSTNAIQLELAEVLGQLSTTTKRATINPGQQWSCNNERASKLEISITDGSKKTQASIFVPNKTKYITYNPSKSPAIYPQTGPFMGLMGKTESGLSLSNNIKASDIRMK